MSTILRPAEYVLPGHPDKLCDAVADALVAEAGRLEHRALAGIEVAAHRHHLYITGRIACEGAETMDISGIARAVYESAGHGPDWFPGPGDVEVITDLCLGPLVPGESEARDLTDDQGIATGYAIAIPETNWLPPEHWLAHRLARRLYRLRTDEPDIGLGPDGKVILALAEAETGHRQVESLSFSIQQAPHTDEVALVRAVRHAMADELALAARQLPGLVADLPTRLDVNGVGAFLMGGPEGDNGLSGKKLVVDAYGPRVAIGGGALSGKDFFKADRAGALLARRIARAVVLSGAAREARATLGWFPGDAELRLFSLEAEGGRQLDTRAWSSLVDLSLAAAGEAWTGAADLVEVARWGHFTEAEAPWEGLRISPSRPRLAAEAA